jgi:hypothetical protein
MQIARGEWQEALSDAWWSTGIWGADGQPKRAYARTVQEKSN